MIAHPSLDLLSTDFSRNDLFLVTFCVIDDWMKKLFGGSNAPRSNEFSDSETLAILLVGEVCHVPRERA